MSASVAVPSLLVHIRHPRSIGECLSEKQICFTEKDFRDQDLDLAFGAYERAARVGRILTERFGHFDTIYHSPSRRSNACARAILEAYPVEQWLSYRTQCVESELLNPRDEGHLFGLNDPGKKMQYPEHFAAEQGPGALALEYPGGDRERNSFLKVFERVKTFETAEFQKSIGEKILICGDAETHFGLLRLHASPGRELTDEEVLSLMKTERPPNCSVTVYTADPTGQHLLLVEKNLLLIEPWGHPIREVA